MLYPDEINEAGISQDRQYSFGDIEPLGIWEKVTLEGGHQFNFGMAAFAQPSGPARRAFYENLRDELLRSLLDAGPVDIVLLSLHGALVAEGYDDCEGDLLARVRSLVGESVVIGVELDLHSHLTEKMLNAADCIISFKEYPHTDLADRGAELIKIAMDTAQGKVAPVMAQFDCKMMGMYPTSGRALRDFLDRTISPLEQRTEVLSISFVHGFPYGDVADAGAKILVVTDNDPAFAAELAQQLGLQIFALRHGIGFDSLSLDEAMDRALSLSGETDAEHRKPIVLADQSDNPGGGAPGDATYVLQWLLEHQVTDVGMAILYDPEVVAQVKAAGVGAKLAVQLGGKLAPTSGETLGLTVEVLSLIDSYQHLWPQQSGDPIKTPMGDSAALRVVMDRSDIAGGMDSSVDSSDMDGHADEAAIDIIVSSERCQCFSPSVFTDFGIDPHKKRMLIPKSIQHFYGAFAPIAEAVIYMSAPGAVSLNVKAIPYQNLKTEDKFPWAKNPHETG